MIDVVGIGAAGWTSLGPVERELVTVAARVVGSERQLALLPVADPTDAQVRWAWPRQLRAALEDLLGDHEEVPTVVLASGDPLLAGVGSTLIEVFGTAAVRVHPAVSSVTLARARMGWPAEGVEVVRLVDPGADALRRHATPGRRLVALSRDASSPADVAAVLTEAGMGASEMTVLAHLGGPEESRLDGRADQWGDPVVPDLHVVCLTCLPVRQSALWSLAGGLPDEAYEHDGQLTKREVRASALAHLMPVPGQLLWDVGAGAGSVAIEWARSYPDCQALALEQDRTRAARIEANARRLGVPQVQVVTGGAPEMLRGLRRPHAVFVGGGASAKTVEVAWQSLYGGGRLVVHAVTVETEQLLVQCWRTYGGQLVRIGVEHLEPLGGYAGWKPARAVVQWSVQKPLAGP